MINPTLSVIIVNYKSKNELFDCLTSVYKNKTNYKYEVIVVDNDEKKIIGKELLSKFKKVKYIQTKKNLGFGGGNNLGAKEAKGKYLFFLNPDTIIFSDTVQNLLKFIEKDKNIGAVAPVMLHKNGEQFFYQGSKKLGVLEGIFSLSFVDKFFPRNPISKKYYLLGWDRKKEKEVDVVPGTAFVISNDVFRRLGGFDESFFLYFEENDLCNRIKKLGLKLYIIPQAKIIHLWEKSTSQKKDKNEIFMKSRYLYFKKYYGILPAFLINLWLNLKKTDLLLALILSIGIFLRFYKLNQLMIFIGDQGWFYLSAYNFLVHHQIPLVGIPSSVVWLRQGPLATYLIALSLMFGKFNPVSPAFLFSIFDVITIYLVYLVGKRFVGVYAGLLSAAFYATSPLIVLMSRMPYHTSPIPLLTCALFLCFFALKVNSRKLFFFLFLLLGLLIQLELSNSVLFVIAVLFFYLRKIKFNKINILWSVSGFVIGILPFIIYDFTHKFVQTIGLPLWIINRIRLFFGLTVSGNSTTSHFPSALLTTKMQLAEIISPNLQVLFLLITAVSLLGFILMILKKGLTKGTLIILLWLIIPLCGFLVHASPGGAYFPLIFPALSLVIGCGFASIPRGYKYLALIIFIAVIFLNSIFLVKNNYYISTSLNKVSMPPYNYSYGPTWVIYDEVAKKIVNDANGKQVEVRGLGSLGIYSAGIDNFKYLILFEGGQYAQKIKSKYYIGISEEKNNLVKGKKLIYKDSYFFVLKDEN